MELSVDIHKKLPGFSLNVQFDAGADALGLLGASGSGKSMTLRCLAGLEKPDKGKIVLNGRVLFDSEKGINIPARKRKIGFLFQNYALFPNMTVEENIAFALEGMDIKKRNGIVQQMIGMVKLEGMNKRYPFQLSGGQQQRAALARALAIEPEALMLDEPLSALDEHLRSHMIKQLLGTIANFNGVTLFVTHNMEEAYRICPRMMILLDGKVESYGETKKIFQSPPTVAAARLTGCKNFSAAKYISENEFEAADWGIKLNSDHPLTKSLHHVGMRANYIHLATENDRDNLIRCWPSFTSETPFRMTVYLSIGKKPKDPDDYQLQWEVTKEKWSQLENAEPPWNICLSPEKLITISQ